MDSPVLSPLCLVYRFSFLINRVNLIDQINQQKDSAPMLKSYRENLTITGSQAGFLLQTPAVIRPRFIKSWVLIFWCSLLNLADAAVRVLTASFPRRLLQIPVCCIRKEGSRRGSSQKRKPAPDEPAEVEKGSKDPQPSGGESSGSSRQGEILELLKRIQLSVSEGEPGKREKVRERKTEKRQPTKSGPQSQGQGPARKQARGMQHLLTVFGHLLVVIRLKFYAFYQWLFMCKLHQNGLFLSNWNIHWTCRSDN